MLQRLYQWTLAKAAHPRAEAWLFLFSFVESSFFPIPPHPLLMVMCLARPERSLRYGLICTLASVLGGLLGYAIGHFLFATVGDTLLGLLHLKDSFPAAACRLREIGWLAIIAKGATPIPYKLVTITAGVIGLDLFTFIWASILSRGILFMLIAGLFWRFGPTIKPFMDKYLKLVMLGFVGLIVAGFVVVPMLTGSHGGSDHCSSATTATISAH
jgi:membrane protein YqaA with SNARE-associated domain